MTVATVHRVTWSSMGTGDQPVHLRGPSAFTTVDHFTLHGANVLADTPDRQRLFAYIDLWSPQRIVVDSTGLGIGLAGALAARYRGRVIPFQFTARSKTDLLHEWLALIETGRYRHYSGDRLPGGRPDVDALRLCEQLSRCEHEQQAGGIRWGVPAHATWTDPLSGRDEPLHDDHLISTALVAALADDPSLRGPREVTSTPAARRAHVEE